MPRLCSDSSRPYPGRSVSCAMRSALRKIPDRTTGKSRFRHIRRAIAGCERIIDSNASSVFS